MAQIESTSNAGTGSSTASPELPLPLSMPSEGKALKAELAAIQPESPAQPYAHYVYAAYAVVGAVMLWLVLSAYRQRMILRRKQAGKTE